MGNVASTAAKLAYKSVQKYGTSVTFTRRVLSAVSPTTGQATATETAATIKGLLSEYTSRQVDGQSVLAGDVMLIVPALALTFVPAVGDSAAFGSDVMQVVSVTPLIVMGERVSYRVQLRK